MYDPTVTDSNADVDGVAVAVASVVIALCLRFQVSFAPAKLDTGIQATLLQTYPILLAAFTSINRDQLSLFDVNFVLNLAFSPLTVYLSSASIGEAVGIETDLYARIESHPLVIRVLGTLLPIFWVALSGVARLSDKAFIDSYMCKGSTLSDLARDVIQEWVGLAVVGGPFPFAYLTILVPFVLLLFRRRSQIMAEIRQHFTQREQTPLGIFRMVWLILDSPWDVLGTHHGWFTLMLLLYGDIGWGSSIITSAISALGDNYTLSYGQILSVITAVPPFLSTLNVAYSHRKKLCLAIRRFPKLFWIEMVYLMRGKELDHLIQMSHLPITNSHPRRESPPTESRRLEVSATGPSGSPAHHEHLQSSIPTPLVLCLPLAVVRDLVPLLLRSEATVESVELVCADYRLSPQVTGFIAQVVGESLPPARQERSRNSNGTSSLTTGIITPPSAAPRRAWSCG